MSLPVWGEWIEIAIAILLEPGTWSLPVWGEWIEICLWSIVGHGGKLSLPVWGEWIEMNGI